MGQYKYKLKEAPEDNLPKVDKEDKFKVGDSKSEDGVKSTIVDIDKETGGIKWDIEYLPNFDKLFDVATDLVNTAKGVYTKAKTDDKLRKIYDEARVLRNKVRTHIRNEYPEEYRRITMNEGELDEMSTTGGGAGSATFTPGTGGQYATPFAFRKKGQKANDKAYKEIGYKAVKEDVGATLGPGPKAGSEGVTDNAYVKQFAYKLVPKKIKGSGMIVKQLFKEEEEQKKNFQDERIEAFNGIEKKLNNIYTMISNAKNETSEYYKNNPNSYSVIKPTDLIVDYLKDIEKLLKTK
tara:strand:+ start:207 stop:1088 length:882 start_codon:yes stop_codon:yes gene_type:complete